MWTGTDQVEAGEAVGGKGRRGNIISSQLILPRCTDIAMFFYVVTKSMQSSISMY